MKVLSHPNCVQDCTRTFPQDHTCTSACKEVCTVIYSNYKGGGGEFPTQPLSFCSLKQLTLIPLAKYTPHAITCVAEMMK